MIGELGELTTNLSSTPEDAAQNRGAARSDFHIKSTIG
jgi:hypothetical protein